MPTDTLPTAPEQGVIPRHTADMAPILYHYFTRLSAAKKLLSCGGVWADTEHFSTTNAWFDAHDDPTRYVRRNLTRDERFLFDPRTVGAYMPLTETQFRVLVMDPAGHVRKWEVVAAASLALWSRGVDPASISDAWMAQWSHHVAPRDTEWVRRRLGGALGARELGGSTAWRVIHLAARRGHPLHIIGLLALRITHAETFENFPDEIVSDLTARLVDDRVRNHRMTQIAIDLHLMEGQRP